MSAPSIVAWSRNPDPVVEFTAAATVTRPTGATAGDLLVVSLYTEGAGAVAPAGWTLVQRVSLGWAEHDVWTRIDDGSAGPWTFSWSGVEANAWVCVAVTGIDPAAPVNASSSASAIGSATVTAPAVTTTVADTLLMLLGTTDGAATGDPPAGMVELLDQLPTYVADEPSGAAGSSGPQTITWSTTPNSTVVLLALAPAASPAPAPDPVSITPVAGSQPDVTIRLQALDGTWETCGADRMIGVVPESLEASANEWGPDTASFDLRRPPWAMWPDLRQWTPVVIEIGGVVVWAGRTKETPTSDGADFKVNVQCEGWQYHLDDDSFARLYVHQRLGDWQDIRQHATALLTTHVQSGAVNSGNGGVSFGWPAGVVLRNGTAVGVGIDLGPNGTAARIVVGYTWANNTGNANQVLQICAGDTGVGVGSPTIVAQVTPGTGTVTGTLSGTLAPTHRYVWIRTASLAGADFTPAADLAVTLNSVKVFADAAYESGGVSTLTASTVIRDALNQATMLLSSDRSQIGSTAFAIPHYVLDKQTTPRNVINGVNAYHGWVMKIDLANRCVFRGRPTAPACEIGSWSGAEFQDASAGSGGDVVNRVIVEATGPDGLPVSVERTAGQQTGALAVPIASPAPVNPSFDVDTSGWSATAGGTLTRDTAVFDTAPASGRWNVTTVGAQLACSFSGSTFRRGVSYLLSVRLSGTFAFITVARFGASAGTDFVRAYPLYAAAGWVDVTLNWAPKADTPAASVQFVLASNLGAGLTVNVDSVRLVVVAPTMVDRRQFRRATTIQVDSAITATEGIQLADVYLAAHRTTPLKGTVKITPGGCRTVLGGRPLDPSVLLGRTQELMRLSHRIDPDTGAMGRAGTIANVRYSHRDRAATVDLDDPRRNFEALLARLAVVQGAQ